MKNSSDELPSWISEGKRLHWYSESQKKLNWVHVSKVDVEKKLVFVTFEVDKKVWKSIPYAKIGIKDCPLRNPDQENSVENATKKEEGSASKEKKKRRDTQDGSVTPDWRSNMKVLEGQKAKRNQLILDEKKKEEDKLKETKRRQDLAVAERRKVEQAFEKRKAEADKQKLKEEEEWRKNLVKQREKETAEEEVRQAEKEERRKKRKAEKEAKDLAEGKVKKPKVEPKAEPKPVVVPPRSDVPDAAAVQANALAAIQGQLDSQPWFMAGQAAQMPAAMMQMMAAAQGQLGGGSTMGLGLPAGSSFGGAAGLGAPSGAWGSFANASPGGHAQHGMLPGVGSAQMLPGMGYAAAGANAVGGAGQGVAQWGGGWGGMPQPAWAPAGKGQFQAPW